MRQTVVAGNWKMNKTPSQTAALLEELKPLVANAQSKVIVCVPYTSLDCAVKACAGSNIAVGAQNLYFEESGAWDFIKWFTSTDAQVKYGNNIESILGTMGRYATANEEALQQLSWTTSEVNLLLDQLNSQVEIPIIPASYGVTRNVMNAFRAVVNDYDNARDTLFWYNKDINDEITRKLEDLGLYDN